MDIRMPELDGPEATRRILAGDRSAKVLVLTTFNLDDCRCVPVPADSS
jgi:CheY-like chemotaxis protein